MPDVVKNSYAVFIENGMVNIYSYIDADIPVFSGNLFKIPIEYAPRITTYGTVSYPADSSDQGKISTICIYPSGNVGVWEIAPLKYGEPFQIIYPLKRT